MKSHVVEGKPILENMRVFWDPIGDPALFHTPILPHAGSLCLFFLGPLCGWLFWQPVFVFQFFFFFFFTFTLIFRKDKCVVAEPIYKAQVIVLYFTPFWEGGKDDSLRLTSHTVFKISPGHTALPEAWRVCISLGLLSYFYISLCLCKSIMYRSYL